MQQSPASAPVAAVPAVAAAPAVGGAILPRTTNVTTGILFPNPVAPTCEVGITLHITNSTYAFNSDFQPTVSPTPSVVLGNLSLHFANLNVTSLQVRALPHLDESHLEIHKGLLLI